MSVVVSEAWFDIMSSEYMFVLHFLRNGLLKRPFHALGACLVFVPYF